MAGESTSNALRSSTAPSSPPLATPRLRAVDTVGRSVSGSLFVLKPAHRRAWPITGATSLSAGKLPANHSYPAILPLNNLLFRAIGRPHFTQLVSACAEWRRAVVMNVSIAGPAIAADLQTRTKSRFVADCNGTLRDQSGSFRISAAIT